MQPNYYAQRTVHSLTESMKFKAKLPKDGALILSSIAASTQRFSDTCVLKIAEEGFELRTKPDGDSEVQVVAAISKKLCSDYRMHTANGGSIHVEVNLGNFVKAMKSTDQALDSIVKLTKRGGIPSLAVTADSTHGFRITQNIPIIRFLTESEASDYRNPELSAPDITVRLPDTRQLRSMLDRMKNIDKTLTVNVANVGNITFTVQTECASMRTHFRGLEVSGVPMRSTCGATFNLKDFMHVMHSNFSSYQNIILCVVSGRALVVHAALPDDMGSITYYLALASEM